MPIYEYICEDCDQEFEKMVRFSEAEFSPFCPVCGSQQTHKQISRISAALGEFGSDNSSSSCSGGGRFT